MEEKISVYGELIYTRLVSEYREEFFPDGYERDGVFTLFMIHPDVVIPIVNYIDKKIKEEIYVDLEWDRKIDEAPEQRKNQLRILKRGSKIKW
ncbi:hypothetical protein [Salmonella phage SSBI34]|nr:hypothetical protein [Salmonella phage SSBI34]